MMKKIFLFIIGAALLFGAISCGDDEPSRGDGVFTVNTSMINHMTSLTTGEVMGLASTHNRLTIDTVNHKASLELRYNDGSDKSIKLENISATPKRMGFYVLSGGDMSGYVDFNEGSMRYVYSTPEHIRVISTTPEVFFLKTNNEISYLDTTKNTTMESTMYQFNVDADTRTAIVKVMDIVHAKDVKRFVNITASRTALTLTTDGFDITADNLPTSATYIAFTDTTGTRAKVHTTDKYPLKQYKATVKLTDGTLETHFMLGDSAIVTATGRTYPDYTSY